MENQKFIRKPELFKFCEFKPELNEVVLFKTKLARIGFFFIGLLVGIPYILGCFAYNLREDKRISLVIGTIIQSILITLFLIPAIL